MAVTGSTQLPIGRRIGYGVGDIGFNLYFTTASLYLLYYYTDVIGLPATTAGWIFAAALIWDGFSDPLMGYLASRTRSRWGRYRPYLLFGTLPLAASWVLMFWPTGFTGTRLVVFTLAAQMMFRTLYTLVNMPYLSLSAAMTRDSAERGVLASIRMLGSTAGGLIIAFFTLTLVGTLGGGDAMRGFLFVAMLYSGISSLLLFNVFRVTTEAAGASDTLSPGWRALLGMLRCNRPFWIVAGWLMAVSIGSTLFGKSLPYLFKYGLGRADLIGPALASITGAAMLAIPFWTWAMRRTSKRLVCIWGGAIGIVGNSAFALAGDKLPIMFAALAIMGIGAGAGYLTFWAMVPDTVEYGEATSGVRAEGVIFGVICFVQKAALGFAVGVLGELLSSFGYVANQPQAPATLTAIRILMLIGPVTLAAIGIALIARYPLDARRHAALVAATR